MRNPSESTNVPRSGPIRRDFEHAMRRLFETKKIVAQPYGAPSKDFSRSATCEWTRNNNIAGGSGGARALVAGSSNTWAPPSVTPA